MKKIVLSVIGLGAFISGCDYNPDNNWRDNCQANDSYNGAEYSRCIDRVARQAEEGSSEIAEHSPSVTINPKNADLPGRDELGKGNME